MNTGADNFFGFKRVKVIAVSVTDEKRAHHFYGTTLGLKPAYEGRDHVGYYLGEVILMLKPNWESPTLRPNYRVTIAADDASKTQAALRERGVVIADEVARYDDFWVGSFLDSEGNKLYFCSPV